MISKETKKELAKLFIDLGKLVFGGVVLATVLKIEGYPKLLIIISGIFSVLVLSVAGLILF
ncbi:MAG: DUF6722 family protein [Bacteroidota bacterium]|nr:DUF6722 family protein [Bacteroidota bacterium]